MQDLHFATNDICIVPRLANLALKSIDGLMKKKHTPKKGAAIGAMQKKGGTNAPQPTISQNPGGGGARRCRIQGPAAPRDGEEELLLFAVERFLDYQKEG